MGPRTRWAVVLILTGGLAVPALRAPAVTASATSNPLTASCAPPPSATNPAKVVVGSVACQELTTHDLGNGIPAPFEYYVPPQCAPDLGVKCPVLYLLHGFGGDYTEMLGASGTTSSAWVQAETHQPPAGFESAPWDYYDPSTWQAAKTPIPFILVAPLGRTLPGGYGPGPGLDSYWVDWNPRYAAGGDQPRYSTPPPRFEQYVTVELPNFVKDFLPVENGRGGQAIAGVSLGGYGAFKLGLQHPDLYSAMMSVSGAHNFLFAPAPGAVGPVISAPANAPIPIAYTKLPAPSGPVTSAPLPAQVGTFVTALDAFGDPAADQAYFRGNMPTDLAANGKGLAIDSFVNDMVPRRSQDTGSEPFELIVFPMNMDMQADFAAAGVPNTFAIHQGNHSDVYRNAWFRGLEEFAYAAAQAEHPDSAPPDFSYRTIRTQFSIWGWRFDAGRSRPDTEFLNLSNVSCDHLTMSGSGTWTVTPPRQCRSKPVVVDLGSPSTVDQPAAVVGQTRTITFTK